MDVDNGEISSEDECKMTLQRLSRFFSECTIFGYIFYDRILGKIKNEQREITIRLFLVTI